MKEGESDAVEVVISLTVGSVLGKDNELFITQVFNVYDGQGVPITNARNLENHVTHQTNK